MMNIFKKILLHFKTFKIYNGECYIYLKDGGCVQGNKLLYDNSDKVDKELIVYNDNSIYAIPYDNHSYREFVLKRIDSKLPEGYN